MKKLYLKFLFAALLCGIFSHAQTSIEPAWYYLGDATNTDNVADFWVNPQGDAYMIGHVSTMPGQPHPDGVMFIKTDTNGQELWRQYIYGTTTNWGLFAQAVIGDESGNVFVVLNENYRYTDYTNARVLVKKYAPNGDLIWSQYYRWQTARLKASPRVPEFTKTAFCIWQARRPASRPFQTWTA
jgi:hypothetical protein